MTLHRRANSGDSGSTRRVVFTAGEGTEILDLVGPLQVFARTSDYYCRAHPGTHPVYSIEVVSRWPMFPEGELWVEFCGA